MKKFFCSFILIFLTIFFIVAQPTGFKEVNDKAIYLSRITTMSKNLISLQSNFEQEKISSLLSDKSISTGIMYFKTPSSLRWEYKTPKPFVFILDNEQFMIRNSEKSSVNSNRMFKEISQLIISLMNGDELTKERNFTTQLFTNGDDLWITMTPKNKRIEQFYTLIEMRINTYKAVAEQIIMHETTGDQTIIRFNHQQKNAIFNNTVFQLN
ncbi:MAG: outer membrane lipoprotein carrier protein LolA [Bacteroidales bacterium]|nr:outer membrane lipoprotein carrier protein LolA [Bacteroidales bacterium]